MSADKAGSRIRVAAQLINALDGDHLWSERFDREMTEVFRLAKASGSLSPNGRMLSALFYSLARGRFDQALEEMATVIAEDPLNAFWRARQAWVLLCADRQTRPSTSPARRLEFDDTNDQARMMIALILTFQGKLAAARESAEEVSRAGCEAQEWRDYAGTGNARLHAIGGATTGGACAAADSSGRARPSAETAGGRR